MTPQQLTNFDKIKQKVLIKVFLFVWSITSCEKDKIIFSLQNSAIFRLGGLPEDVLFYIGFWHTWFVFHNDQGADLKLKTRWFVSMYLLFFTTVFVQLIVLDICNCIPILSR